jgi:hypothetical protein
MQGKARRKRGEEVLEISIGNLKIGDHVIVEPGEMIPIDGTVRHGRAFVEELPHTGEPFPVAKEEGATLIAGTRVLDGRLEIVAADDYTEDRATAFGTSRKALFFFSTLPEGTYSLDVRFILDSKALAYNTVGSPSAKIQLEHHVVAVTVLDLTDPPTTEPEPEPGTFVCLFLLSATVNDPTSPLVLDERSVLPWQPKLKVSRCASGLSLDRGWFPKTVI